MSDFYFNPEPDELMHSKYLRKYMGKSGKMIYVYKDSSKDPKNDFQTKWKDFKNKKGETLLTTEKGHNKKRNFTGVSIGKGAKSKKDYKYYSKSIKLGKKELSIDNDEGRLNVYIFTQRKKNQINKGRNAVKKYLR